MSFSIPSNTSPKVSSVFLVSLALFLQFTSCFHWDGNILYDLETNTLADFTVETTDWTLSTYETAGVKFYDCAGNYVMGGYGVLGGTNIANPAPAMQYFQRIYSSLPTHNQIYIQMTFYQIDSWDLNQLGYNDHFSISVDGNSINGWDLNLAYSGTYPLCGNTFYADFVFTIALASPHSASSLTLRMISYTNEDTLNESFGFRDIKIEFLTYSVPYLSLCAPGVPSSYLSNSRCQTSCTSSGHIITPAGYGFCQLPSCSSNCQRCSTTSAACTSCPIGSFLIDTTCYSTCDSPLTTKTLGGVIYCETPCSGQYAWWDGSCSSPCSYATSYSSYAIVGKTANTFQVCTYPCATNQFLSWNTSCLSSCPSPLITTTFKIRNFCEYPCTSSQHLYWNGSCLSTCPSPLTSEIQGTSPQQNFCWYTCSETQYLYWNGSCIDSCPYPLVSETQSSSQPRKFCWYPCQPSEYLYWNGSCLSTCPSPLSPEIQGTSQQRNFCWYTCSETQYLSWNGSCLNSCPYPLTPETQYGVSSSRKFCWYTCQLSEFLYWNGSCLNNCPSPLSPETQGTNQQRNFCWYTCDITEYLYWNQSCLTTCPIPLLSFDYSGNQFCFLPCSMPTIYWYQDFSCRQECNFPYNLVLHDSVSQCLKPCSKSSEFFYDLEKECHDTCDPPYVRQIINTIKICHITRSTLLAETNKIKSTAEVIETLGKTTSIMLKAASIPRFSSPRPPFLTQLSALMQYIRYMRINYPWRVQQIFQSNDANLISLNIDFSIPNKIQDKFDNYPLPDVFEKYNLESNFINNMWDLINTVLLVIFGILALLLLKQIFRKNFKMNRIILRILQSLRWNMPLAMISAGAGEIIFFASLQIRNTPLGSAISIVSFFISFFMIFWILVILVICIKILRGFHLQRQKVIPAPSVENQDWHHKWKGYEVLYEEVEEKYLFSLAYTVIYVIRAIFFFTIIANFYEYPFAQSIIINVINFLIFGYLLYYKPLKDIWNTIQLLINEILGNILTVCVLVLAIMDKSEIEARDSRTTIGNVMIIIMLIFYILGVVFLVIEGILFLIEAYKTWKEMRARGIKNPFEMIQILLFGEPKTAPQETVRELSQASSRLDLSTIHTKGNNSRRVKPYDNHSIGHGAEIKERNLSMISDIPGDASSRSFLHPREYEIARTKIRSVELEIETSRANLPNMITNEREIESPSVNDEIPGFFFRESYQPRLQPNVDHIQNWGNLKARMKRFNQSVHKIHWPSEE